MQHEKIDMIKTSDSNTQSSKRKILIIATIVVAVLIGLYMVLLARTVAAVYAHTQTAKDQIITALQEARTLDFATALAGIGSAQDSFSKAERSLDGISVGRYIPGISGKIKAGDNLLKTATSLTNALKTGTGIASDLYRDLDSGKRTYNDLTDEEKKLVVQKLALAESDLHGMYNDIVVANNALQKVTQKEVGGTIHDQINPLKTALPDTIASLDLMLPFINVLPDILGFDAERNYLFILQNDLELRPTGGLASTYGIVTLENGLIKEFGVFDSYKLDQEASADALVVDAPAPIAEFLGREKLVLRDANWIADFPTAAKELEAAYLREAKDTTIEKFDAVLATTPTVFTDLLALLGPQTALGTTIDKNNLRDIFETEVEGAYASRGLGFDQRKELFDEIAKQLKEDINSQQFIDFPRITALIKRNLDQKNILIASNNEEIKYIAQQFDWDGSIENVSGDYIFVVDANVRNQVKIDRLINRSIDYKIEETDDSEKPFVSTLQVTYTNNSTADTSKTSDYATYTRVYLPAETTVLNTTGFTGDVMTAQEFGKTVVSGLVNVAAGARQAITLEYLLNNAITNLIDNNRYDLYIQKQPGTSPFVSISTSFDSPIASVKPQEMTITNDNTEASYSTILTKDISLSLELK